MRYRFSRCRTDNYGPGAQNKLGSIDFMETTIDEHITSMLHTGIPRVTTNRIRSLPSNHKLLLKCGPEDVIRAENSNNQGPEHDIMTNRREWPGVLFDFGTTLARSRSPLRFSTMMFRKKKKKN